MYTRLDTEFCRHGDFLSTSRDQIRGCVYPPGHGIYVWNTSCGQSRERVYPPGHGMLPTWWHLTRRVIRAMGVYTRLGTGYRRHGAADVLAIGHGESHIDFMSMHCFYVCASLGPSGSIFTCALLGPSWSIFCPRGIFYMYVCVCE